MATKEYIKELQRLEEIARARFYPKLTTDAIEYAIKSIEAWEKVKGEISEYLEEYSGTDENGWHDPKWCAMSEAMMVVEDCLTEVKGEQ